MRQNTLRRGGLLQTRTMRKTDTIPSLILTLLLVAGEASAQPVFVKGAEDGQGFLRQSGNACYLVTPQHVLGQAREAVLTGDRAQRHKAVLERRYDPDLALLRIETLDDCPTRFPDGGALDQLLQATSEARLVSRSNSGAVRQVKTEIIASDERFIRIRAENGERLFRGMSGSPLKIGGSTAGMLQTVNADNGTGMVLRQDYMSRVLESWFPEVTVPSRPYITNKVRPTIPTNDAGGLIANPDSEPVRTRPAISGGVRPARPLPSDGSEKDEDNNRN